MNTKVFYGFSNKTITTDSGFTIDSGTEMCIVKAKNGSQRIELISGFEYTIGQDINPELILDNLETEEFVEFEEAV